MLKPFYILIKISPNSFSGDAITIGLILRDESGFRFAFSNHKKSIAKSLIEKDKGSSVDFIESQIISKLQEINNSISDSSKSLFSYNQKFTAEYFSYLNSYSNGLLQFSIPSLIEDELDDLKFTKLFELLVDKRAKSIEKVKTSISPEFYSRINSKLIQRVQGKVHTNKKINNSIVPSLISEFEIDCIGLNGTLIGAKSLSLNESKQKVTTNTNAFINVIVHLSLKYQKPILENNFYLIADEPSEIKSEEHMFWERLINEQLFKMISSEEVHKVAELIEEKQATTFLE